VVFCIFGIPVTFITLSNLGEWLAEAYWIALTAVRREKVRPLIYENILIFV
jgi:hypothetical protein